MSWIDAMEVAAALLLGAIAVVAGGALCGGILLLMTGGLPVGIAAAWICGEVRPCPAAVWGAWGALSLICGLTILCFCLIAAACELRSRRRSQ